MVSDDDELAPAKRLRLPFPGPKNCSYNGWLQHTTATIPATAAERRHSPRGSVSGELGGARWVRTDRQHSSSAAAPTAATTYVKLRWDCTSKLARPTIQGSDRTRPAALAAAHARKARNGSNKTCGCHGSISISLPIDQLSDTHAAAISSSPRRPASTRPCQSAIAMAAPLITATPSTAPALPPRSLTNGASASNSNGPGLLKLVLAVSDADVHVPSHGWLDVNTSAARSSIRP